MNPRDPRNLLAACMLTSGNVGTYTTFDGGQHWHSTGTLRLPAGVDGGGDVSAAFDGAGRGFVCGLVTQPPTPATKGTGRSIQVWRTEDGGRTFAPPVAASGTGALDGPWLTAERHRPHAIHVVWAQGTTRGVTNTLLHTRSIDGGHTFAQPRQIASVPRGLDDLRIACGPPAGVYVLYDAGSAAVGTGTTATVTVICSHDGGQTFKTPIELGRDTIKISFPGTFSLSLPALAADANSGMVCSAFSRRHAGAGHADILVAASHDQGRHWSPANAITPPDRRIYFQPQVAVDPDGRIGVMAFAMAHNKVSVVLMLSEPGSLRFGPPITVSRAPFDPTKSGFGAMWWIGDYQALAATRGVFHPLWNDTRTGQLQLYTATVPVRN